MTRIEVNDSDWCYVSQIEKTHLREVPHFSIFKKGIVNGLIIRGSLGRKCVEVAQETFCCQEHLCNEANSLTLGSITVVVSSIINFIHRKK